MDTILGYMEKYDFENLLLCQDRALNFKAIIAIHDTTLGPATGGCRMWQYDSEMDAIEDALRLSRGMTYKYAAAGVNLGGGKTVIIGHPGRKDREPVFRALGKFINRLGGKYITGEDVGTTLRDMEYIRMETEYVVTLPTYLGSSLHLSQGMEISHWQASDDNALEIGFKLGRNASGEVFLMLPWQPATAECGGSACPTEDLGDGLFAFRLAQADGQTLTLRK